MMSGAPKTRNNAPQSLLFALHLKTLISLRREILLQAFTFGEKATKTIPHVPQDDHSKTQSTAADAGVDYRGQYDDISHSSAPLGRW